MRITGGGVTNQNPFGGTQLSPDSVWSDCAGEIREIGRTAANEIRAGSEAGVAEIAGGDAVGAGAVTGGAAGEGAATVSATRRWISSGGCSASSSRVSAVRNVNG